MSNDNERDIGSALLGLALLVVLAAPLALWGGYCLSILWGWFVVPLGAVPLTLWGAAGLNLVVYAMTSKVAHTAHNKTTAYTIGFSVAGWALALLFGWAYYNLGVMTGW